MRSPHRGTPWQIERRGCEEQLCDHRLLHHVMGLALLGRARGDAGADLYAHVRCLDLCPASVGDDCESRLGRDSDGSSDASIAGLSKEAIKEEPGLLDQRTSSLA